MAHERHADFLQDARLHQTGVEGVAEIVETHVADSGVFQRGLPGALYDADLLPFVAKDNTVVTAIIVKPTKEPGGERDFAAFPLRCFGAGDEQNPLGKIDIFPELVSDLAASHT